MKSILLGLLFLGINIHSAKPVETPVVTASTHIHGPGCGFFPANNLRIPIRPTGQMSELQFRQVLQVVAQVYEPIFRQNGRPKLAIFPKWTDDTVNAYAFICNDPKLIGTANYPPECNRMQTSSGVYTPISVVSMFGGLARHPLMTQEGLIIVACHEIGHHLAGYPRYAANSAWAATEGQSDYFATAKCARKVFKAIGSNALWAQRAAVTFEIRNTCVNSFGVNSEAAGICMRSSMASLALARVLGSLKADPKGINFSNVDKSIVSSTFEAHPAAQCRLDTYVAGAVCRVPDTEDFSAVDPRKGSCGPGKVESTGFRPRCWYRPPTTIGS
ncbi:MAG: hypothetical protein JNL11_11525 [Bdellovibrionaceae bacterium]|nr:hypothetical protein [Pseudobdellovibrionaceae bacterium]